MVTYMDANGRQGRPRAQEADRHVGDRIRDRRVLLGLTQQQAAALVGVTYQQWHKYEKGINRVAAGRLAAIARTLGVEVGHFFADLGGEPDLVPSPPQRLLLDLARAFVGLSRQQQEAVCSLARALGKPEPASGSAAIGSGEAAAA